MLFVLVCCAEKKLDFGNWFAVVCVNFQRIADAQPGESFFALPGRATAEIATADCASKLAQRAIACRGKSYRASRISLSKKKLDLLRPKVAAAAAARLETHRAMHHSIVFQHWTLLLMCLRSAVHMVKLGCPSLILS